MRMLTWLALTLGAVAIVAAALVVSRSHRDLTALGRQIDEAGSVVVRTEHGDIEVPDEGAGSPVLVVHGIWGGFDQGVLNAEGILPPDSRRISVSRYGYLRSPMPAEPSPERQADHFASLLDHLGLATVAVVAHSAGSTSALQLALRHPERVSALVLVSPAAPRDTPVALPPRPVLEVAWRSDLLFWALTTHAPRLLHPVLGVPEGYPLTSDDVAVATRMAASVLPASRRAEGALYDAFTGNAAVQDVPLEAVKVPTLVVGAVDDPLSLWANTRRLAERIPGAELLALERGGHLLLGSAGTVEPRVRAFLERAR